MKKHRSMKSLMTPVSLNDLWFSYVGYPYPRSVIIFSDFRITYGCDVTDVSCLIWHKKTSLYQLLRIQCPSLVIHKSILRHFYGVWCSHFSNWNGFCSLKETMAFSKIIRNRVFSIKSGIAILILTATLVTNIDQKSNWS